MKEERARSGLLPLPGGGETMRNRSRQRGKEEALASNELLTNGRKEDIDEFPLKEVRISQENRIGKTGGPSST